MGNWTIFLNKQQEEKAKRKIINGEFPSVYALIKNAVMESLKDERKN